MASGTFICYFFVYTVAHGAHVVCEYGLLYRESAGLGEGGVHMTGWPASAIPKPALLSQKG